MVVCAGAMVARRHEYLCRDADQRDFDHAPPFKAAA
jgi:hypothetical protein